MEDVRPKPQVAMLFLSTVLGILLGTSILLATKINNPPVTPRITSLDHLLWEARPGIRTRTVRWQLDLYPSVSG